MDTVVATVDGAEITLGQMIITRNQLPPQYQELPDDVLFQGVLDQLIQQQLLAATLPADPGRVTVALQNERRALLAGEAIDTLSTDAANDAAVQATYDELFGDAEPMTEYNASHILVASVEEAEAAISRIEGGAVFGDVARELSTDFGSGANGGSLGWFGPGMMVAPFEEAVVALTPGEMSDPIETQFGWHVILLNETREQEPPTLEAVRAEIENQLRQEAIETRLRDLLDSAEIELPEPGAFDPVLLRDLDILRD